MIDIDGRSHRLSLKQTNATVVVVVVVVGKLL